MDSQPILIQRKLALESFVIQRIIKLYRIACLSFCNIFIFRVSDLLSQLNTVGENNNFFQPEFSVSELSEIPGIYKNFVEDPIMLREALENDNSSGLSL